MRHMNIWNSFIMHMIYVVYVEYISKYISIRFVTAKAIYFSMQSCFIFFLNLSNVYFSIVWMAYDHSTWWRFQMLTFSALLAICAGNSLHRSPVNSPHKGQWRGASVFSLIWVWINGWVNSREAGNLRRYRAHYDTTVMIPRKPRVVMMPNLSSIVTQEIVITATFGVISDDKMGIMATLGFQCKAVSTSNTILQVYCTEDIKVKSLECHAESKIPATGLLNNVYRLTTKAI